jgi:hypothetical protein
VNGSPATRPASPSAPASVIGADHAGEAGVRRFVTVLAVTVGGLCFLFSAGNVYQLAVTLNLWVWIRPLVAPAVDLSLVALVVGIRFLAIRGVGDRALRRPRLFMLGVGLAAWALNTAGAAVERDWGKAAFDSLAPALLLGWAEVLPWFLRQFHATTRPGPGVVATVPGPAAAVRDGHPSPAVLVPAAAPVPVAQQWPAGPPAPASAPAGTVPAEWPSVPPRPGTRRRPSPSRPASRVPAADAALLARAAQVAEAFHAEHGRPISRDALGRALRVGNRAAGELLRALRAATQDRPGGNGTAPRPSAPAASGPDQDGTVPAAVAPAPAAPIRFPPHPASPSPSPSP